MNNLNQILKTLLHGNVEFVLIGGYASVVHGSNQVTRDLDICAALTINNINELRECLKDLNPKHRMNPGFKPSFLEIPKENEKLNAIYLETDIGILDILSSVVSVGDYEILKKEAVEIELFGYPCKVISLPHLIASKEALNRDKDKIVLKELYAIRDQSE